MTTPPAFPRTDLAILDAEDATVPAASIGQTLSLLRDADVLGDTWADFSRVVDPGSDVDAVYETVERLARFFGRSLDANRFWIGDLLVFGEGLLGDRFDQAAEAIGLRPATVLDYLRVAERVPRSRRRENLHYSHHRAVASREPDAQTFWLDKAEAESMTVQQLEDALRIEKDGPPIVGELLGETDEPNPDVKRVVAVAKQIASVATREGNDWRVPAEQMAQLRAALRNE